MWSWAAAGREGSELGWLSTTSGAFQRCRTRRARASSSSILSPAEGSKLLQSGGGGRTTSGKGEPGLAQAPGEGREAATTCRLTTGRPTAPTANLEAGGLAGRGKVDRSGSI